MEHIDRVSHVQTLAKRPRHRRVRVQVQALRLVRRAQDTERIVRDPGRRWHLGQQLASRTAEPQLAVRFALDLDALFMHRAVVPATQDRQIRERRRSALRPVLDVMALSDPHAAPRKATTAVAMLLHHENLTIQDSDAVTAALETYRRRPALVFSDCLILEVARKAGHLPLGTFDRNLSRIDGAQKI